MDQFIRTMKRDLVSAEPKFLTLRARIATEVFQENPARPAEIRRALTFERFLEQIPVVIRPGELIVGVEGLGPGDTHFWPEFAVEWLPRDLAGFDKRTDNSRLVIDPEDREFIEQLPRLWQGRTINSWVMNRLPDQTKKLIDNLLFASVAGLNFDIGHMLPGYDRVLNQGLAPVISRIEAELAGLDLTAPGGMDKKLFYESALISCRAAIAFAHRYADEADRLAGLEADPVRRVELAEIAQICRLVPERPAESFHEAVQSFWFTHLLVLLESKGMGVSPGRFDQYMHPFYKQDINAGRLTRDQAGRLLNHLWLKFNEVNWVLDEATGALIGGYPSRQNMVVGGQTPEGKDAVNDLSYLCLEVTEQVGLHQPSLSLRYHSGLPEKYLRACCRLLSKGLGLPAVYNDEVDIPAMLNRGVAYRDALDFALVGCVELAVPGKSWTNPAGSKFNLVRLLELAVGGGKLPGTDVQLGPEGPTLDGMTDYQDLWAAYRRQLEAAVGHLVVFENLVDQAQGELAPCPFLSCLVEDCLGQGRDIKRGGAIYNFTGPQGLGLANAADGLAAIKKTVFEDRSLTAEELVEALANNFKGAENVRAALLSVPKYGNDDDYVDDIARQVMDAFALASSGYSNPRGGLFQAGMFPATANVAFGAKTGATPDGRAAGQPFADSVSPAQGRDVKGIIPVLKSVAKLNHIETSNGTLLNQRIHPATLKDEKGVANLAALIRSYCDMKGMEIQFNVVDAEVLRRAQETPDDYRSLVVRVAGWSALFTGLSREVQDDIISRTEQQSLN